MSKLAEYYSFIEGMEERLTNDQRRAFMEIENELINEEILPAISKSVSSVLANIRTPLTMVIEFDPSIGITVKRIRDKVIVDYQSTKQDDTLSLEQKKNKDMIITVEPDVVKTLSKSKGFEVTFPDGTVVRRKNAKTVFVDTLRYIGLDMVALFRGRTFKGFPLVGKRKRTVGKVKWQEEVDGWYIYINMNNATKRQLLRMISDEMHLELKINNVDYEREDIAFF